MAVSEDLADEALDPVRKDLQGFCPYLHELPAAFTTFWHQLHGAALLVEHLGRKLKFTPAPVAVTKAACATGGRISGGHCPRALPAAGFVSSSGLRNSRPSFPVAWSGKNRFCTALMLWLILSWLRKTTAQASGEQLPNFDFKLLRMGERAGNPAATRQMARSRVYSVFRG